jgi:hypothetical protein
MAWSYEELDNVTCDEQKNGIKVIRTYQRHFDLFTTTSSETIATAKTWFKANVVNIFDVFPGDSGAYANAIKIALTGRVSTSRTDLKYIFRVDVDYTSDRDQVAQYPWYPYSRAKWSGGGTKQDFPMTKDLDGRVVQNSAKDPPNPPLMVPAVLLSETLNVSLHYSAFTPQLILVYGNTVNSSTFRGWARGCAQISNFQYSSVDYVTETGGVIPYYDVSVSFDYNPQGFQPVLMSTGLREIYNGQKRTIVLPNGQEATEPLPLDEDGAAILGTNTDNAHYQTYKAFNYVSYSGFNL